MQKYRSLTIDKLHVLILHEHHNKRYLLIQTEKDLYRIALEILDWRFGGDKNNHGYYVLEKPKELPQNNTLSEVEISQLPSEDLKILARQQQKDYESKVIAYNHTKDQYIAVRGTLLNKDGKRAWRILNAMSDAGGEDDGIDLIPLETTYSFT
jgi:hypothetical protein